MARRAFTLIEVVMSMAIFSLVMVGVVASLSSTMDYESLSRAEDDLNREAVRIQRLVGEDLTGGAWYLTGYTTDAPSLPSYASATPAQDRNLRYWPFVIQQAAGSNSQGLGGTGWAHLTRSSGLTDIRTAWRANDRLRAPPKARPYIGNPLDFDRYFQGEGTVDEAGYARSFFARSQELVFARAAVGTYNQTTGQSIFSGLTAAQYQALAPTAVPPPVLRFPGTTATWRPPAAPDPASPTYGTDLATWHAACDTRRAQLGVLAASGFAPVYQSPTDHTSAVVSYLERTANQPYGVVLEAGIYDPNDEETMIKLQPEMVTPPVYKALTTSGTDPDGAAAPLESDIREYTYAVVPSDAGLGRLVRAYKVAGARTPRTAPPIGVGDCLSSAGGYSMVVDRVLSDNVTRVVFDTWRTVDRGRDRVRSIGLNTIRMRLYLMAHDLRNGEQLYSLRTETYFCMRAQTTAAQEDQLRERLGTAPVGLRY